MQVNRCVVSAAIIAAAMIVAAPTRADEDTQSDDANRYVQTNLTSDLKDIVANTDPVLQNSWGVAFTPAGSPFWIADNATGCSTLYDGTGIKQGLQVSIPLPGNIVPSTSCQTVNPKNLPTNAAPTGIIWNPSSAFVVPGSISMVNPKGIPALFIFDTEDGTISAWAGGLTPILITRSLPSTIRKTPVPQKAPSTKVSPSASTSTEDICLRPISAPGRSTCSGLQAPLAAYSHPRRPTEASRIRISRPALRRSAFRI